VHFFIDTADTTEIRSLAASGLLDGVIANPSLIARSGRRILDDWAKTGQQIA
jgi:transaldolase